MHLLPTWSRSHNRIYLSCRLVHSWQVHPDLSEILNLCRFGEERRSLSFFNQHNLLIVGLSNTPKDFVANMMNTPAMSGRRFGSISSRSQSYTPVRSLSSPSRWSFHSPSSRSSTDSTTFWRTPPKTWRPSLFGYHPPSMYGLATIRKE